MVSAAGVLLEHSDMADIVPAWRYASLFFDAGPNHSVQDITGTYLAVRTSSAEIYDAINHIIPG